MSGITLGTGLFSGLDTQAIIDQLIAVDSRPKTLAQQRLFQLQTQQAAILDLNSRMQSLKTAAGAFRIDKTFRAKGATSSDETILTATANKNAQVGTFTFVVDRLVSTQQSLSRGFSDRDTSGLGLTELTIEADDAKLTRDISLGELNGGTGIDRGSLLIDGVEVDLSRAATVDDVLDAINSADGLTGVTASVSGGGFVIEGATTIASGSGDTVAEDLGLAGKTPVGGTITGDTVYQLYDDIALQSLNDGRGVGLAQIEGQARFDFRIQVDGNDIDVNLGNVFGQLTDDNGDPQVDDNGDPVTGVVETPVTTLAGVVERINAAIAEAADADPTLADVSASIDAGNGRLVIDDASNRTITVLERDEAVTASEASKATTAADLGIKGTATGTINGDRLLAGLNTVLVDSLNGGLGLEGDGDLNFATADGSVFTVNVGGAQTVSEVLDLINDDPLNAGKVTARLNDAGNGLELVDNTSGANAFIIAGTPDDSTAASLGIEQTGTDGIIRGSNVQMAYIGRGTLLEDLNNGNGIGVGTFTIRGTNGGEVDVSVTDDEKTVGELLRAINQAAASVGVKATLNDSGDGIMLVDADPANPGANTIQVTDSSGSVGRSLGILGEADGTGDDNVIDGSFERTITFDATDTLDDVVDKINNSGARISASVIDDGTSGKPFRLSLVSRDEGSAGRFIVDAHGFELGLDALDAGEDAVVFFGSKDPADGILLTNSSNTLDALIPGVTIDLKNPSDEPVDVSITRDNETIEAQVDEFVSAFNDVLRSIDQQTRFVEETGERGPLLGDGGAISLRQELINRVQGENDGFSDTFDTLARVGISIGEGGLLEFDRDRFRTALEDDPDAVEALFTRRDQTANPGETEIQTDNGTITVRDPNADLEFSALGVMAQLEEFADDQINTIDGVLTGRNDSLQRQIDAQNARIEAMDVRLEQRREILERQFLAMESAIGQMQTQQATLSQITTLG